VVEDDHEGGGVLLPEERQEGFDVPQFRRGGLGDESLVVGSGAKPLQGIRLQEEEGNACGFAEFGDPGGETGVAPLAEVDFEDFFGGLLQEGEHGVPPPVEGVVGLFLRVRGPGRLRRAGPELPVAGVVGTILGTPAAAGTGMPGGSALVANIAVAPLAVVRAAGGSGAVTVTGAIAAAFAVFCCLRG
jgi:hypothetical protein